MPDLLDAPRALIELYAWPVENQVTVLKDVPGGTFNQYVVMDKESVHLAIRADRGDWDLTMSLDSGDTFWQVDQLETYLDGRPWIGEPASNEHRAEFVRPRLDELEARWRAELGARDELSRLGDEWMSWRFGIPIPDGEFLRGRSC